MRNQYAVLIFSFLLLIGAQSCKVQFVPDYDAEIAENIDEVAKSIDRFYLVMMEKTREADDGRAYENFVDEYIDIEVELNSLLNQNRVRPLNENSIRICEITLETWQKYRKEHKADGSIGDGLIRLNRKYMNDLMYSMMVAERAKAIADQNNEE